MHVGDDTVGFVAEFKGQKGPAWRRALDMVAEASRRRAAAREALKVPKELPDEGAPLAARGFGRGAHGGPRGYPTRGLPAQPPRQVRGPPARRTRGTSWS